MHNGVPMLAGLHSRMPLNNQGGNLPQVVELTEAGRNFFSEKFVEYDKDGDKLLSSSEQAEMFSTAPTGYVFERESAHCPALRLDLRQIGWQPRRPV